MRNLQNRQECWKLAGLQNDAYHKNFGDKEIKTVEIIL
jgi:hypothetical protein